MESDNLVIVITVIGFLLLLMFAFYFYLLPVLALYPKVQAIFKLFNAL